LVSTSAAGDLTLDYKINLGVRILGVRSARVPQAPTPLPASLHPF
jgi:hypothetical protein